MQQDNLGLKFPQQTKNISPGVDLSLAGIEKWRSGLQTADLIDASKNILKMLMLINETILPVNQRFEILELISPLIQNIFLSFKKHYINQTEPLAQSKINILDLSKNLHFETLNAYKSILVATYKSNNPLDKKTILPNAIYKSFKYFNSLLMTYYQSYTEPATGIWLEIHAIYQLALNCKLAETYISSAATLKTSNLTITPYKYALFMASINPYQWRQQEQETLLNQLVLWDSYINIRNFNSSDKEANDIYLISKNQDLPPFTTNTQKITITITSDEVWSLDLSKLTNYLKNHTTKTADNNKEFINIAYILPKLLKHLNNGTKRSIERFSIMGDVFVTFGFPATHYHINNKKSFKPELIGSGEENDNSQELQLGAELEDVIDNEKIFKPDSALYQAKLTNINAKGVKIIFENMLFAPIQPGEIMAMAINIQDLTKLTEQYWNIGILCWLKHTNKETKLEAGMEIIAPFALAAAIQLIKENTPVGYFHRAFICSNNSTTNKDFNIITSNKSFETGKKVKIFSFRHKKTIETTLKEQLLVSNNFKLFKVDLNLPEVSL